MDTFKKHRMAIAKKTLRMPLAAARIMGGMTHKQAWEFVFSAEGITLEERMSELLSEYPNAAPGQVVTELTTYGWDGANDWRALLESCGKGG